VRAVVVVIATIAPACSLLVSLDGLNGDGAADVSFDVDGGAADAPLDGPFDAPVDGTMSGFCATHAPVVFCDDFDTPDATPFAKWSTVLQTNGGSASLIAADASPPNAAHFHDPPYDSGGVSPQAAITRSFVATPTMSMTYQFDMRVERYPTSGTISFSPIKPDLGSALDSQLYFSLNAVSAAYAELITFSDGGTFYNGWTLSQRPTPNVWMHVEIDWTLGTPNTVTVYLDEVLAMAQNMPIDSRITFGAPFLTAGISYEDPGSDLAIVDVDNVVFDFQ
jgi:hypothetical protein